MEKKKLLIGVPGFLNSDKMFGVTGNYMEWMSKIEGDSDVRIIMPHEEFVEVDLLILPGGMDLNPSSYKKIPSYQAGNHDVFKEFFFKERLANYVNAGTPIFGICLGFQMLNVHFGGTLTQNLIFHEQSVTRWSTAHEILIPSWSKDKNKPFKMKVNSHHHQAVSRENDISDQFYEVAYAEHKEKGLTIIEAFMHNELNIAGVQYHPEEMHDDLSAVLIRQILGR